MRQKKVEAKKHCLVEAFYETKERGIVEELSSRSVLRDKRKWKRRRIV
nr:hypothetical protein [Lysinibacillus timonensis]